MKIKKIVSLYLRSPLNIAVSAAAVGGAALLIGLFGVHPVAAVVLAAAAYAGVSAVLLRSGRGIGSIVKEKERDRLEEIAGKLDEAVAARKRIAFLRIPDDEIAAAVQKIVYVSGGYIESCRKYGTYSPEANARLDEVLNVLSAYLRELDETAAERHFGVADDSPVPDMKRRTLEALSEDLEIIKEKKFEIDGGLDGGDILSIREDLR